VQAFDTWMRTIVQKLRPKDLPLQSVLMEHLALNFSDEIALIERVSSATAERQALRRIGAQLPRIIRGEVDPLQLLTQDELLSEYYKGAIGLDSVHRQ
jgi:hypothetical protein